MSGVGTLIGIFGTGRNGSTLLMRLLDGSPGLWVHPVELTYLALVSDLVRYGRIRRVTALNASTEPSLQLAGTIDQRRLTELFEWHATELEETYAKRLAQPVRPRHDPLELVRQQPRYAASEFLPVFLESFRQAYDDRPGAPRYTVFKTLETPYIAEYERVYPTMRFLHILRHPLTTYSSLKRTNIKKGWPFWRHGGDELQTLLERRWIPHARYVTGLGGSDAERHLIVRYEDLCGTPGPTIARICHWLGVATPSDPTLQTVLGGKRMAELPSNPSQTGVKTPERVVANMAEHFGYDDVVSRRERDWIVLRTYPWSRRFGYFTDEDAHHVPGALAIARSWLWPDRWELRHARSLVRLTGALIGRRSYIYHTLLRSSREASHVELGGLH